MESTHLELRKWFVGDMAHVRPEGKDQRLGQIAVCSVSLQLTHTRWTTSISAPRHQAKAGSAQSSSRCLQRQTGLLPPALRKGVLERLLAPGGA